MSVVTPAQVSFNGGELSPRLHLRIDQAVRGIAVKRMDGWLPLLQGPAEACPGTIFVAKAKGPHRLIPYRFNATQTYQIEAGEGYCRFYTNDAPIETAPGTAYEVASPWTLGQARSLYVDQSLDVLYCATGTVPLKRLFRTGADSFAIEDQAIRNGPFDERNDDETLTVAASGTEGEVTITSSSPLFEAGDVGGLMEIEGGDFAGIVAWEAGMAVAAEQLVQVNGNVYQRSGGESRTGTVAPFHVEGAEYDGMRGTDINNKGPYGVAWTFLYNRWGLVRFAGFVDAQTMTAMVVTRLPSTAASWRWRFGAFSPRRGYPEAVTVWQERLALFKGNRWHLSVAGGLDDFSTRNEFGDETPDMAASGDLPGADGVRWVHADINLILATAIGERVLARASNARGIGPGNIDTGRPASFGAASGQPVEIDGRVVYIQRARGRVVQMVYDADRRGRSDSPDLSRNADHLGEAGFAELAWCRDPARLLWVRRDDGTLAVCAFDPDEALLGWATRTLGGGLLAETVSSILDPEGRFPQLWIGARADGEHWVLRMPSVRGSGDASEQVMTDASVRRTGAASTAIAAPHLAGRTVQVVADGYPYVDSEAIVLDAAGNGTLPAAASDVIVGLGYPNALVFLPPDGGSENGPAIGKRKRAVRVDLHYLNSDALEVECQGGRDRVNHLRVAEAFAGSVPLRSGKYQLEPRTDHDDEMVVTVRRTTPRAATLLAAVPHFESAQR